MASCKSKSALHRQLKNRTKPVNLPSPLCSFRRASSRSPIVAKHRHQSNPKTHVIWKVKRPQPTKTTAQMWSPLGSEPLSSSPSWRTEPEGRGHYGIISTCLITLSLCIWSALHLNVPEHKKSAFGQTMTKIKWLFVGLVAPEVVRHSPLITSPIIWFHI